MWGDAREDSILSVIDEVASTHQFVFVDLEGTASLLVSRAIAFSDFVIIPIQASSLDVKQAARAIQQVRNEEKIMQRSKPDGRIPYRLLLTRTPAPGAPRSSSLRKLEQQLAEKGFLRFRTGLAERQAYKAVFDDRLTLEELTEAGRLDQAKENAIDLVNELLEVITSITAQETEVANG